MILDAAYDLSGSHAVGLAAGVLAGFALGAMHFGSLVWTARCLAAGVVLRTVALQLGRFGPTAAGFAGISLLGGGPMLAALAGLLLARQAVMRLAGGVT